MAEKPLAPDQAQAKAVGQPPVEITGTPSAGQVPVATSATQAQWAAPPPGTLATTVVSETSFGQAASAGSSPEAARADHTHGTPADPVPAHDADANAHPDKVTLGTAQTVTGTKTLESATFNPSAPGAPFVVGPNGTGQLVAGLNSDKLDGKDAADFVTLGSSAPTSVQAGDTASAGSGTEGARTDHRHAVSTGVDADIQSTGAANAAGTSTKLARADHVHATGGHALQHEAGGFDEMTVNGLLGTLADPQKIDVQKDGVSVAVNSVVNFTGNSVASVVNNTIDDRVDVTLAHGDQGGGSLHAVATPSAAGFMSAADKSKIDNVNLSGEVQVFDSQHLLPAAGTSAAPVAASTASSTYEVRARTIVSFDRLNQSGTTSAGKLYVYGRVDTANGDVQLWNATDATELGAVNFTETVNTLKPVTLSNLPATGDKVIELRIRGNTGATITVEAASFDLVRVS